MRKLLLMSVGTSLLLLAISVVLFSRVTLFHLRQDISDGRIVEARGNQWVGQSFVSHYPGLVEILIRPADSTALRDDQIVILHLEGQQPETRDNLTLTKSVQEIRDGDWLRFTFDPLDDSQARRYSFFIWSAGEASLQLQAHHQNMYPEGELFGGGDLVFEVGYGGMALPTINAFLARAAENKPGLFGQSWFYVVMLSAYMLVLGVTALVMVRFFARSSTP